MPAKSPCHRLILVIEQVADASLEIEELKPDLVFLQEEFCHGRTDAPLPPPHGGNLARLGQTKRNTSKQGAARPEERFDTERMPRASRQLYLSATEQVLELLSHIERSSSAQAARIIRQWHSAPLPTRQQARIPADNDAFSREGNTGQGSCCWTWNLQTSFQH
ncbi:PREDICTED: uncharacterized protein LOC109474747 [Branchiostoma belcheri]|uniref:Uncharacterized protein LOC109474747 n=1 Tax=Branchiostoma belcheri TaxID=7741 RepID=A0A6P4YMH3_BRABE|nr:PREDICTED: uncharacterized protein LOC109474747 [Branchiostoma belcheri]